MQQKIVTYSRNRLTDEDQTPEISGLLQIIYKKEFLSNNGSTIPITKEEVTSIKSRLENLKNDWAISETNNTESTINICAASMPTANSSVGNNLSVGSPDSNVLM